MYNSEANFMQRQCRCGAENCTSKQVVISDEEEEEEEEIQEPAPSLTTQSRKKILAEEKVSLLHNN